MHNREIPSMQHLIDISYGNISRDDSEDPFDAYNEHKLYKLIWDYYQEYSDIHTLQYKIKTDEESHTVNTLLGVEENKSIEITNTNVHDSKFTQFDEDTMESIGFEVLDDVVQDLTDIVYKNYTVNVGRIDFKSLMAVSDLFLYELANAYNSNEITKDKFPIRNKLLQNTSDFKQPVRPRGSTSGGVIVANTNDGWKLILGQRSEKANINRGKISIFPNGKTQYSDFIQDGFLTTLKREFTEELFDENSKGDIFFDDYITVEPVSAGWNLRDGDLSVGYLLVINSTVGYDIFKNTLEKNKELDEIVEVPIDDFEVIKQTIDFDNMSGAPISTVCEGLKFIDESKLYPDLPYDIDSSADFDII